VVPLGDGDRAEGCLALLVGVPLDLTPGSAGGRQQGAMALRAWAVLPDRCPAQPDSRLLRPRLRLMALQAARRRPIPSLDRLLQAASCQVWVVLPVGGARRVSRHLHWAWLLANLGHQLDRGRRLAWRLAGLARR
jgi:hypothetical protein